jgi:AraC-like DNA-binding protein
MSEFDYDKSLDIETDISTKKKFYEELAKLFTTIEEITGLEVCIFPSENNRILQDQDIKNIPHSFLSHSGSFCRIIEENRTGNGCGGYDSVIMVRKSAELGKPFVNICHAGLGAVIFPVYDYNHFHIATVFIGQVLTDEICERGFPEIRRRVHGLGVDEEKLRAVYHQLPRLSKEKLLRIGELADFAIKGLGRLFDFELPERQLMLDQYPPIKRALQMINDSSGYISEIEIAEKLNLHQSYLSRLFRKVMKCNFKAYMIRRRIQQAKMMLHHSRLPIMEVAVNCGFNRQSYFTRQFKKITGMTPSSYRKGARSNTLKKI